MILPFYPTSTKNANLITQLKSFRISTALPVQRAKELFTANQPCLENAQASLC